MMLEISAVVIVWFLMGGIGWGMSDDDDHKGSTEAIVVLLFGPVVFGISVGKAIRKHLRREAEK